MSEDFSIALRDLINKHYAAGATKEQIVYALRHAELNDAEKPDHLIYDAPEPSNKPEVKLNLPDQDLLGAENFKEEYVLADETAVPISRIVARAFEMSGMSQAEWNGTDEPYRTHSIMSVISTMPLKTA